MLDTYHIQRVGQSAQGTFGVFLHGEVPLCITCEDPWNNNSRGISCIPEGTYLVKKFSGAKYHDVWEVMDVPERSAILIHNGNNIKHTEGCILVGNGFSYIDGLPSITDSVATLGRLRTVFPDEFYLEIR